MKVVITYASWLGHNESIAKALAQELVNYGNTVVCAQIAEIEVEMVSDADLLVFGSYTHAGHTSGRLLQLCDTLPYNQFERTAVAVFGTQLDASLRTHEPAGIDDLLAHLAARGIAPVVPPLRFGLTGMAAILPDHDIAVRESAAITEFAQDLMEACIAAPLI